MITFLQMQMCFADDSTLDLAKQSQNPVANMITVPFNNNFNFGYGPENNTQYILDIKPVIPVHLNPELNLITRTIIPIMHQPNLAGEGQLTGLGDVNPTFFFSPSRPGKWIWGLGPIVIMPTASHLELGQGKWSAGPSFVVLTMPGHWVIGTLMNNVWSFAGHGDRRSVNQFLLQYFINYNFSKGWFITSQPVITANWMVESEERWTVPFGLGVGRVFSIGKQAINASLQAYDNVISPKSLGPDWQMQLNVSLLFPL